MLERIKGRFGGQLVLAAVSVSVVLLIGMQASWGDAKGDGESKVEKMMQAAHKGKKNLRDAPLEIVQDEVKKDQPDWALLAKNTKPLTELAGEIKDNRSYTSNPGPYVKAVKALRTATEQKSVEGARAAVAGLMNSCAGCHREN